MELMADIRKRKVDVIVIWALGRLARSLKHLLTIAEECKTLAVDIVCLKQNIDTTLPAGRLTFQVLGAVAEFEREMLRERVKAGMAQAKRSGKRIGRPALRHFSSSEIEQLRSLRAQGKSVRQLAKELGTTQWMITRIRRPNQLSCHVLCRNLKLKFDRIVYDNNHMASNHSLLGFHWKKANLQVFGRFQSTEWLPNDGASRIEIEYSSKLHHIPLFGQSVTILSTHHHDRLGSFAERKLLRGSMPQSIRASFMTVRL